MKRKTLFSAIVIIFLFFFLTPLFYYFSERKEILRKNAWDIPESALIENKPQKGEGYLIKYKGKNFDLVKYIFSDSKKASDFLKEILGQEGVIFKNRGPIEIDSYSGLKGISLKTEGIYIIILRKDNFIVGGNGKNEENLIKVIKWFIRKKF